MNRKEFLASILPLPLIPLLGVKSIIPKSRPVFNSKLDELKYIAKKAGGSYVWMYGLTLSDGTFREHPGVIYLDKGLLYINPLSADIEALVCVDTSKHIDHIHNIVMRTYKY